jgi:hypothetical protein
MSPCLTGKRRYTTRRDAKIALADILRRDRKQRREQRIYRCPSCNDWHLTSQGTPRPA